LENEPASKNAKRLLSRAKLLIVYSDLKAISHAYRKHRVMTFPSSTNSRSASAEDLGLSPTCPLRRWKANLEFPQQCTLL